VADHRHDLQAGRSDPARRGREAASRQAGTRREQRAEYAETGGPTAPCFVADFQRHTFPYVDEPDEPVIQIARGDYAGRAATMPVRGAW